MPMHVLFCLDYYAPHVGGAELLFRNLAEGLVACGHRVTVVTQRVPHAPAEEILHGVRVLRVRSGCRAFFPIAALPLMCRLAPTADLIHATTFAAAWPAWIAARWSRKPALLTVHEVWLGEWNRVSDAPWWSNAVNSLAERSIYWLPYSDYVAVSHATGAALARRVDGKRIHVIYNGIDNAHWNPRRYEAENLQALWTACEASGRRPFVFFFSGRPGRSKGLPVLLRALAKLGRPEARLVCVVSHSPAVRKGLEEARRLVRMLHLEEQVRILESRPYGELPRWVKGADCVCVPSLSEGFGFCAAEACAMQRPVIATDNASLPEVVGGKCLLVPPGDSDALAEAMAKAMEGRYEQMPSRSFSLSQNIEEHILLYRKMLGGQA